MIKLIVIIRDINKYIILELNWKLFLEVEYWGWFLLLDRLL